MNCVHTSAVKSVSFKSKVTCAVVGSNGVSTTGIAITRMCLLSTFINVCERREGNSTAANIAISHSMLMLFLPKIKGTAQYDNYNYSICINSAWGHIIVQPLNADII